MENDEKIKKLKKLRFASINVFNYSFDTFYCCI